MAIFGVIDTGTGADTFYEGMVKDAANWAVLEAALSAATTHILVGGGAGTVPVMTAATGTGSPVRATSPTLVTPVLGTPASGTLTNCTGLPVAGGGTGRATGTTAYALVATGTTATGAQQTLAAGATTEVLVGGGASALPVWTTATGSGAPVRATSPTLTTPTIGVATATSINKVAITAPATSATLTIADGTTLTVTGNATISGTPSLLTAASQAQAEAGTADTVAITPLSANWHPGVAKAFLVCDAGGTINASHNITSITDTATGVVTVTLNVDFSSANYCVSGTTNSDQLKCLTVGITNSGAFNGQCVTASTGAWVDPNPGYMFACFGDQ